MPAVKGDGMRGLAVFISDIRNCKYIYLLQTLEEYLINIIGKQIFFCLSSYKMEKIVFFMKVKQFAYGKLC